MALGIRSSKSTSPLARADGGVDSAFSLEPDELRSLVIESGGPGSPWSRVSYGASTVEKKSLAFRRSLYAVRGIAAGSLHPENVRAIRPGFGLPPKYLDQILRTHRLAGDPSRHSDPLGHPVSAPLSLPETWPHADGVLGTRPASVSPASSDSRLGRDFPQPWRTSRSVTPGATSAIQHTYFAEFSAAYQRLDCLLFWQGRPVGLCLVPRVASSGLAGLSSRNGQPGIVPPLCLPNCRPGTQRTLRASGSDWSPSWPVCAMSPSWNSSHPPGGRPGILAPAFFSEHGAATTVGFRPASICR